MKIDLLANNPKFLPTIAKWYDEEWGDSDNVQTQESRIKKLSIYLNTNSVPLILTAIENNELIGVAQIKEYEMAIYPKFQYWLGGVYVKKEFRHKGIAKFIVMEAIHKAKELKINKLFLQTENLNGGLYKKLGWTKIEEVNYNNIDVAVMENDLRRHPNTKI